MTNRTKAAVAVAAVIAIGAVLSWPADDRPTMVAAGPDDAEELSTASRSDTVPGPSTTPPTATTTTRATPATVAKTSPTKSPTPATSAPEPGDGHAPTFQQAAIDRKAGTITLTFDRAVKVSPRNPVDPGMRILVFGQNATCDWRFGPNGNGHALVSGGGTPTVTFTVSGLTPGTVHVGITGDLVVAVAGGLPNEPVPCVAVPAGDPVAPTLRGGTADVDHSQVDLYFDTYADEGDPSQLFVYSDATCTTLVGRGTKIEHETQHRRDVTVTAPGFVVGRNWIRAEPGLVVGDEGGLPNTASPCIEVPGFDAPRFVSAAIDLERSTLSITYDRPIHLSSWVAVYTATTPGYQDWARATRYVGQEGLATIVLEMPNLRPGTNYVKIWEAFVGSTDANAHNIELPWFAVEAG